MIKFCPVCKSSRLTENQGMIMCHKCGYTHLEVIPKTQEEIEIEKNGGKK